MLTLLLLIVLVGALLVAVTAMRRRLQNTEASRPCCTRIVCHEACHSTQGCKHVHQQS